MNHSNLLKSLFAEATVGLIVVNGEEVIIKANPFCEVLFNYKPAELIGSKIARLLPKIAQPLHVSYQNTYIKEPKLRTKNNSFDLFGVKKEGLEFPVEVSLGYAQLEGNTYAIAYISDNSHQRNLVKNLKESEARLAEAQRLAKIGSFEYDLQKQEIFWSKGIYRVYGIDPEKIEMVFGQHLDNIQSDDLEMVKKMNREAMIGQRVIDPEKIKIAFDHHLEYIHPDDLEKVKKMNREAMTGEPVSDNNFRIITPQKTLKYLEGKIEAILDEQGNTIKIIGSVQDVTELREAKNINEDIFKIVEESLNEVYIFDATTFNFLQVNKGARKNIGYTQQEMLSMNPLDLLTEFDSNSFKNFLLPLAEGSKNKLQFETLHQRKDGSSYPLEAHIQYFNLGTQTVYVSFVQDTTSRKKYEQQLLGYSDQLELKVEARTQELIEKEAKLKVALKKEKELGELKSRFVSMASHEFRTPLSAILSSANLISRYEQESQLEKRKKHVNRIVNSVRNLNALLNDFLSLEKLEAGQVNKHEVSTINIKEYMSQIIDEVSLTAKKGQKIVHHHEGIQSLKIDEQLLHNILINLLSNGIKYSKEDQQIDLMSLIDEKRIKLQVIDHGIGIPEKDKEYMFTRFFRATNVTNIQGTGLGLTIVKRYLDLLGGEIDFESKEGEGTTFTITIPIHEKDISVIQGNSL